MRILFILSVFFLTSCATQKVYIDFNTEDINLDRLPAHRLALEIDNKTKQFLSIQDDKSRSKLDLALTLGYLHYQTQNFSKARYYFATLPPEYPLQEYDLFYQGKIALDENNCSLASSFKQSLLDRFSESTSLIRLEELIKKTCQFEFQAKIPEKLTAKERHAKAKDLYEDALIDFEDRNYPTAIRKFWRFINTQPKTNPHIEDAFSNLATIYKLQNQKEDYLKILWKLAKFQKAHNKEFPYHPKWLYEIVRFYWNEEQTLAAKKYIQKLLSWPNHNYVGNCYFILAKISAEEKNYQKAFEYLNLSYKNMFASVLNEEIAYLKGWYAYKAKNWEEAIEAFENFRDEFPKSDYYATVSYWLARTYENKGENQDSKNILTELAEKNPYSYYGIRSLHRLKKPLKPTSFQDHSAFSFSKNAFRSLHPTYYQKALNLIHLGLGEDGAQELKQAANFKTLFNTSWRFQYYMASLYSLSGDYVSAFTILNGLHNSYLNELPKEHVRLAYPKRYWELIQKYAKQFHLDPYLILSVMRQESAFDPQAISTADAYGLLQMTPYMARQMAKRLNITLKKNDELLIPEVNIRYCTFYLAELLKTFDNNLILALAGYTSSQEATKKWVNRLWTPDLEEFIEEIPYKETRSYVKLILRNFTNNYYIHEGTFKVFPEDLKSSSPVEELDKLSKISTTP